MHSKNNEPRLNHYYPAATLAAGYCSLTKNNNQNNLKVNCINIKNLLNHISNMDYNFNNIFCSLMERENFDIKNNTPRKNRILSEIKCSDIFTSLAVDEDPNDKKSEQNIQPKEQNFLRFIKKLKLYQMDDINPVFDYIEKNRSTIIDFVNLTIDRVPFFNEKQKINYKKAIDNSSLYLLNVDISMYIMSDLLPIVPIDYEQIIELKNTFNNDPQFQGKVFPINDCQLDILKNNHFLMFPLLNNGIMIFCENDSINELKESNLIDSFITLYAMNTAIFSYEIIVYNEKNKYFIVKQLIELYINIDIENERNKFISQYHNILHTKLKV